MTENEKQYHSALSQCAELLDNMKDGDPILDTPKYLAAKLEMVTAVRALSDFYDLYCEMGWAAPDNRYNVIANAASIIAGKEAAEVPSATNDQGLLACPFCGGTNIDPAEWVANDGSKGPGCGDCGATAENARSWNRRAFVEPVEVPSQQGGE